MPIERGRTAPKRALLMEIIVAVALFCLYPLPFALCPYFALSYAYGMAWRGVRVLLLFGLGDPRGLGFLLIWVVGSFGCLRIRCLWVVDGVEMRAGSLYHQEYRVVVVGEGSGLVCSGPKVEEIGFWGIFAHQYRYLICEAEPMYTRDGQSISHRWHCGFWWC